MTQAKVITVDDDPFVTQLVQRKLGQAGILCDVAASAEEALQLMKQNLYFLVIADVHMGAVSGVQLVSALKQISPLVQVIMLTMDTSPEVLIACADRGVVDFFEKDGDLAHLVTAAGEVLGRRERWASWLGLAARQSAQAGSLC